MKTPTEEEIEAVGVHPAYQDEPAFRKWSFWFRWGEWPLTGYEYHRASTRVVPGHGYFSRYRVRVLWWWCPWFWKGEAWIMPVPRGVEWIQYAQRWLFWKGFSDHTVTVLGSRFSWEFVRGIGFRKPWLAWVLGWPLFLFLNVLRRIVQ